MPDTSFDGKSATHKPLPQCKAFLICEEVEVDDANGRFNLYGLVDSLSFPLFPANAPPLVMFLQLYDGIGRYALSSELRDLARGMSVAAEAFTSVEFPERLVKIDLGLPIDSLRLPGPGRYELAILLDGHELATQLIDAESANDDETR
ncbi:MAG TPA: hypothetical protein VJ783_09385 [Pirellulales bacterium]|nr:hypothetical protein [Pirellulales bacterium]